MLLSQEHSPKSRGQVKDSRNAETLIFETGAVVGLAAKKHFAWSEAHKHADTSSLATVPSTTAAYPIHARAITGAAGAEAPTVPARGCRCPQCPCEDVVLQQS